MGTSSSFNSDTNVPDPLNSSSTPLAANGVFTGQYVEVISFSSVSVTVLSNVGSKFAGVRIEWSTDGVTSNVAPQLFTFDPIVVSQDGFTVHATVRARFYRVVYQNNASDPQASFVLTSLLRRGTPAGTVRSVDPVNTFSTNLDVQAVQSLSSGLGYQNPEQVLINTVDDTDDAPHDQGSFLYVSPRPVVAANIRQTLVPVSLTPVEVVNQGLTKLYVSITNNVLRGNLYIQFNTATGLSTSQFDYKIPPGHTWQDSAKHGGAHSSDIYGFWDEEYIHSVPIQAGHARVIEQLCG